MDYFLLALAVVALGLMGRLYAVFLAKEEVLVKELLALFALGALVSRGGKTYRVVDLEMGYAMMVCLSTGKLRCVDLMTPAGTYRHGMIHEWARGEPIAASSAAAVFAKRWHCTDQVMPVSFIRAGAFRVRIVLLIVSVYHIQIAVSPIFHGVALRCKTVWRIMAS